MDKRVAMQLCMQWLYGTSRTRTQLFNLVKDSIEDEEDFSININTLRNLEYITETVGYVKDKDGNTPPYLSLTNKGQLFIDLDGWDKEIEAEERESKILELTEEAHKHSKESLAITKQAKADQIINTRWVKIAAWAAIIGIIVSIIIYLLTTFYNKAEDHKELILPKQQSPQQLQKQ